jgi:hypothetical protein
VTNPAEIGAGFLAMLKTIPALVTEMGEDEDRIVFYEDVFPGTASKTFAIGQMVPPSILLCFEGTNPGVFNRMEVWRHRFSLLMRPGDKGLGDGKATTLWSLLVNGVPTGQAGGQSLRMMYVAVHDNCYPMEVPSVQRNSLLVGDAAIIDYYEAQIVFTEYGDDT